MFLSGTVLIIRFGARGVEEARGVRPNPDNGSRPKSQLAPGPNPGIFHSFIHLYLYLYLYLYLCTTFNPGPQRSPRFGPNRDPSTLTLPNGPNLTQRPGKRET